MKNFFNIDPRILTLVSLVIAVSSFYTARQSLHLNCQAHTDIKFCKSFIKPTQPGIFLRPKESNNKQ